MNCMIDQLAIGDKASFDDFCASLKQRIIHAPKKKSIKETVPFSNRTYDFSAINGEVYWEERQLDYIFEIIADSPEELERKKAFFSSWVMNVMNESIFDPFEPGFHYLGTFEDIDYDDDESIEKSTITVVFMAYPYKIANVQTIYNIGIPAASNVTANVVNDSSHRIAPTLITNVGIEIQRDGTIFAVPAGEVTDDSFMLEAGANALTISNPSDTDCVLTVKFFCEVF